MIRTQIYLPEDLNFHARLLAKREKVNFSTFIRQSVEDAVKKKTQKKAQKNDFIGALKYGPRDLSTRINDIYK